MILQSVETDLPLLSLQWSWLHLCVAISCQNNHISAVINGRKIHVEKTFPEGFVCLKSLKGNLVLQKIFNNRGIWTQAKGKVTNLNIFSGLMPKEAMVVRTSGGEGCGKQDGDFLSWTRTSWSLQGAAKWTEVSEEDLCRKYSDIQTFTTQVVSRPDDCKQLCSKFHKRGRITSVQTPELFDKLGDHMRNIADVSGSFLFVVWLPMAPKDDIWVDSYSGERILDPQWNPGYPVNDSSRACAIDGIMSPGYSNWPCLQTGAYGGWYCTCHFPDPPFLRLRGLCKDSYIDRIYMPYNSPVDAETTYYGNILTHARFLKEDNEWKMEALVFNTTALSKEISKRFMLGKQNWTIEGDSKKCSEGKAYTALLKLTGCTDGEFTCDDGLCIKMEERCNQVPDCEDKSDERGCRLIVLEGDYNKNIPPIGKNTSMGGLIPARVSISITLMKVVEIEERDHSIHLQFEIFMQWRENRVKYQNLKDKTSLNALSNSDIEKLWLPLIVYDNTDQKQSTRLGWINEWVTGVSVVKEGDFTRSGLEEVDEAEMFKGDENNLTMVQTYTREFQCKYMLQRYPFDTQVKQKKASWSKQICHQILIQGMLHQDGCTKSN